jgi:hypothetical protein
MTPTEIYDSIYTIVVREACATESCLVDFIAYHTDARGQRKSEWRFQGSLGYGGKFRRCPYGMRYSVDCYPEDETTERVDIMRCVDAMLSQMPWWCPS